MHDIFFSGAFSFISLGECIDVGESVADFLDDIFLHYGDGCERVMTQSGIALFDMYILTDDIDT